MEKEYRTFQLSLDEKQISVLVAGLHELPGKLCNPVLGSIQEQITKQTQSNNNHTRKNNNNKS